jgi:hypothetical protein
MSLFKSIVQRLVRTSRTLVGLLLIITSIVGMVLVVRASAPGDRIVMAAGFIPAGTILTEDILREGRVSGTPSDLVLAFDDVVGRVVGVDVGNGEFISLRMLEATPETRIRISVPLGITPPSTVEPGSEIELWSVDPEGAIPPQSVASNSVVLSVVDGGLGGATVLTVLVTAFEVDRVLAAIGAANTMLATEGQKL